MLKDKLNIYKSSIGLEHKCIGCDNYSHYITECPYLSYVPNKEKCIINYIK